MPALKLENLVKRHGDTLVLDDVSLDIEDGEFVCLLGPSGCGKTTLLRIIAGLDAQTSGRLRIDGRELSRFGSAARDCGMVFQSSALFPNLTVAGNIAYGLLRQSAAARRARVLAMLELVGLASLSAAYPAHLSGGQQQRVALARALAPAPSLLLLDEPLSALDAPVRAGLRQQIRALHDRLGLTTIMVTHDQEEALAMADRIVVLRRGRIQQSGSPECLYQRPASRFVADFIGVINLVEGRLIASDRLMVGGQPWRFAAGNAREMPPSGAAVTVAWRPEDTVPDVDDRANPLSGQIESLEYLGPIHRIRLQVDGFNGPILADLAATLVRDLDLAVGQTLRLSLPPERLRLLPADAP